ncbi:MAG: hypothetical protein HYS08_03305 [Chlamydiae bacterium]|nr:hypothetical protein [Chlamydiota bacterium]MBI3267050.1 hypothetical protein [Chlamydiota bacterium]
MIHANEARLQAYMEAAEEWAKVWPQVEKEVEGHPLLEAHAMMAARAQGILPFLV